MLNKWNLRVARFVSKDASRYTLQSVCVTKDATVATNGHQLVWVSTSAELKAEDFPEIPHAPRGDDQHESFLLGAEDAVKIEKALPRKSAIPALLGAAVSVKDGQPIVCVTDLELPQVFRPKPTPGQFPQYEKVIPAADVVPAVRVMLSASYLASIAKFAAEFNGKGEAKDGVLLTVYGADKVVRFDAGNEETGQAMTALLMPMAITESTDVKGSYGWAEREAKRAADAAVEEAEETEKETAEETAKA